MMLRFLGEHVAADKIDSAVAEVLREGKKITADLGGSSTTTEFSEAVIEAMR